MERLLKRRDFLAARDGVRAHSHAFVLQLMKRSEQTHDTAGLRVGFTVTKKVGNAVVRNRIKRRLRCALAQANIPHIFSQYDAVVIARIEAATSPFTTLITDLENAFSKAHLKSANQSALRSGSNTDPRDAPKALQNMSIQGTSRNTKGRQTT